jgi:ribosomal protein S18 acetylase RimI-like enzyme
MITVRDATPEDASTAAAVHIAAWQMTYAHVFPNAYLSGFKLDAWIANHLSNINNSPPRMSLVAIDEPGGVVGFLHGGPARVGRPPSYDPEIGEVYAIYVHPDRWGAGAGRALMQEAIDRFAKDGRTEIRVWVLDDNPRARTFYERMGFELDGATDSYVADRGGPHETAVDEVRYTLATTGRAVG